MNNICVGERLNRLRKSRGLSLEGVASGVGVTSSHISQIENGKRQPSFNLVAALAGFFDVDPIFFIDSQNRFYGHGQKLRIWREGRGASLEEIACLAEFDAQHLKMVENGEAKLNRDELKQVADALEIDFLDFQESLLIHLNRIREMCRAIFNMTIEETEEVINFIKKRIHV